MRRNRYIKGDYNVICDMTGFKVKASTCRLVWDGHFVKHSEWEPRHPQDFVKGVPDMKPVPIARPEPADKFIGL
jgi:hypothetical protein